MPSVVLRGLPSSITSLPDKDLFAELRSRNVNVGPIVPTTRGVYERKLYALETGQVVEAHSEYPPADSDDQEESDDEHPQPPPRPQPRQRTTFTERREEEAERLVRKPSPRRPLHPGIGDYPRRGTPVAPRKTAAAAKSRAPPTSRGRSSVSVPVWVIIVLVTFAFVIFGYFVFRNMESDPDSSIPDKIEMDV